MEQKRLFVGNLPFNVNEHKIEKKFSKFGNVLSTEVKQRLSSENEVISKFAYVTLEADRSAFDECIQILSSKAWKGHNLKLEYAKESFLSKLQRERNEKLGNIVATEEKTLKVKKKSVEDSSELEKCSFTPQINGYHSAKSFNKEKVDPPMFKGRNTVLLKDDKCFKKNIINSINEENTTMKIFEDFNEVWRDKFDAQYAPSTIPIRSAHNNSEPSYSPRKMKNNEVNMKVVTEATTPFKKWFQNPTRKQIANSTQNSNNNLNYSSSEDDYKKLKEKTLLNENIKVDDTEIVCKDYSSQEQQNINKKFQNKFDIHSTNSDDSFIKKNIVSEMIKNNTSSKQSTVNADHFEGIKQKYNNQMQENIFGKLADEKRKKANEEKVQIIKQQKNAVKMALAGVDIKGKPNKKIKFTDNGNLIEDESNAQTSTIKSTNVLEPEKKKLFDDESDNEETSFKVNQHFEGVKGQKLLELQSRYAHDQRFTLDSRFNDDYDENNMVTEVAQSKSEKEKQLDILEQVIGYQVRKPDSTKKNSSKQISTNTMLLRFDPTRSEHSQFIVQPTKGEEKVDYTEKKRKKKSKDKERIQEDVVNVSKEKFYKVHNKLKDSLQANDNSNFSLRKLFNSNETESEHEDTVQNVEELTSLPPKRLRQSNPFKYDSSDTEGGEEDNLLPINKPISQPTLLRPFFFQTNDPRFEELNDFFGKHEQISDEDFCKKRKDLQRLLHHRQMNNKQKNRPFKNKIGGARKRIGKKSSFRSRPTWGKKRSKPR